MYVLEAILPLGAISKTLADSLTWLGYFNSAINPAIYAFYSKQFRAAFIRLTIGKFYANNDAKQAFASHYFYNRPTTTNFNQNVAQTRNFVKTVKS